MRAAIVGGGFIGNVHIEALRRLGNIQVIALCDEYGVKEKAARQSIGHAYTDYRKMIDELKLDVVHICTPNSTHYEIARYAVEKGIHVMCEKPFTGTLDEAEELTKLAEKKGVKGAVNYHNRLYPAALQMKHMISQGDIGKVISIHGTYIQDWLLYDTDYSWRVDAEKGGKTRAVSDIGSHWLDLVQFASGQKIRRVNARFSTVHPFRKKSIKMEETFSKTEKKRYEEVRVDTEDIAAVLLEFANGAIGSMTVSQVFAGKKNAMEISIAGTGASLWWNTENLSELYIGHRDKPNEILTKDPSLMCREAASAIGFPGGHAEGFADAVKENFRQFYKSLEQEGEYVYADFQDGVNGMRLCSAILDSARSQQWVSV